MAEGTILFEKYIDAETLFKSIKEIALQFGITEMGFGKGSLVSTGEYFETQMQKEEPLLPKEYGEIITAVLEILFMSEEYFNNDPEPIIYEGKLYKTNIILVSSRATFLWVSFYNCLWKNTPTVCTVMKL
ncbi:MAG: hypothetical protein KDD49_02665 [Bacteroidetes bacterium]|nr:hypothetical protein [Bacteroidota bacterium]